MNLTPSTAWRLALLTPPPLTVKTQSKSPFDNWLSLRRVRFSFAFRAIWGRHGKLPYSWNSISVHVTSEPALPVLTDRHPTSIVIDGDRARGEGGRGWQSGGQDLR